MSVEPYPSLPESWTPIRLGEVSNIFDRDHKTPKYADTKIPLISPQSFSEGGINFSKCKTVDESELLAFNKKCNPQFGDILYSRIGTIGKARQIDFKGPFVALHSLVVIKPNPLLLDSKFLFYMLGSPQITKQATDNVRSIGTPDLSLQAIANMSFNLPPLAEQHRIVAVLDMLTDYLEHARAELAQVESKTHTLRLSLAKKAFGNLGAYDELGKHSRMCLGKMLDEKKNKGVYRPYLRNVNVRWFGFDLSDVSEMRFEPDEDERYSIVKGDLVLCEGGEPGRCAIWQSEVPMKIQKALHRVRVNPSLDAKYLMHYLWYISQTGTLSEYYTGTTIKHLTGQSLKRLKVPIIPVEEQRRIASELEAQIANSANIDRSMTMSIRGIEQLRHSVLDLAFSGKFVPQDPNDEPASVLLERIRAERTKGKERQAKLT